MAVEKLEGVYKLSDVVNQVWVYGNSFESTLVCVVVPVDTKIEAWAKSKGIAGTFEVRFALRQTGWDLLASSMHLLLLLPLETPWLFWQP